MSERVVILGASGYIGSAIRRELDETGVPVIAHSSKTLDLTDARALRALDDVMGPDATLVLAAALTPDRGRPSEVFTANVRMAVNVGTYLKSRRIAHCVYLSSDAVYGGDAMPVTEATEVMPANLYGCAKYAGERILESATSDPLLILRITGVYGPRDPHGAYGPNQFARDLATTHEIRLFGAGEEERDHLYIDDVGRLAVTLIRSHATGVFNLATGQSRSFAAIVEMIRGIVADDVQVLYRPRTRPVTHRHFDTSRLHEAVPDFLFTPFEDGLRATLRAFGGLP